jgi:hypothetical protein
MGKRSGAADNDENVAKLTLDQVDHDLERCAFRAEAGGSCQGRKSFFKRPVWLEAERERSHDILAPTRRF